MIFQYVGQVTPDGFPKIPDLMWIPNLLNSAPKLEPLSLSLQFRVVSALPSEALVISDSNQRAVFMARRKSAKTLSQHGLNKFGVRRHSMIGPLRLILGEGKPASTFFLEFSPEDMGDFYKRHCTSQTWVSLPTTNKAKGRDTEGTKRARKVPCDCSHDLMFISRWF